MIIIIYCDVLKKSTFVYALICLIIILLYEKGVNVCMCDCTFITL